jgi:hypothetical protein
MAFWGGHLFAAVVGVMGLQKPIQALNQTLPSPPRRQSPGLQAAGRRGRPHDRRRGAARARVQPPAGGVRQRQDRAQQQLVSVRALAGGAGEGRHIGRSSGAIAAGAQALPLPHLLPPRPPLHIHSPPPLKVWQVHRAALLRPRLHQRRAHPHLPPRALPPRGALQGRTQLPHLLPGAPRGEVLVSCEGGALVSVEAGGGVQRGG